MYEAVLSCALVPLLFNTRARLFAVVMIANWLANYVLARQYGLFPLVSVSDAMAFIAIAALTIRHPHWWSFMVAQLAFSAVLVHVMYWTTYGLGLDYGRQYQTALNGAFLLSALILFYGGYDVGRLVGSAFNRLALVLALRRGLLHSRSKAVQGRPKVSK